MPSSYFSGNFGLDLLVITSPFKTFFNFIPLPHERAIPFSAHSQPKRSPCIIKKRCHTPCSTNQSSRGLSHTFLYTSSLPPPHTLDTIVRRPNRSSILSLSAMGSVAIRLISFTLRTLSKIHLHYTIVRTQHPHYHPVHLQPTPVDHPPTLGLASNPPTHPITGRLSALGNPRNKLIDQHSFNLLLPRTQTKPYHHVLAFILNSSPTLSGIWTPAHALASCLDDDSLKHQELSNLS